MGSLARIADENVSDISFIRKTVKYMYQEKVSPMRFVLSSKVPPEKVILEKSCI
jgi:hypothetical protein